MLKQTNVIVGMGEIGSAFYEVLKPYCEVVGVDLDKSKCRGEEPVKVDILHICIPYLKQTPFIQAVLEYDNLYRPKEIIIHSSVEPRTTEKICSLLTEKIVAYSPFRGVHARMVEDMKRYIKHYAFFTQEPSLFVAEMLKAKIPIQAWNDTTTSLELAKLWMDVVYYGWLIIFAQHTKVLADHYGVDEKKLWVFTDEIHKYLGNRPRMFSGEGIGGHCVLQDKELLNDPFLDAVFSHDQTFRRNIKNGR